MFGNIHYHDWSRNSVRIQLALKTKNLETKYWEQVLTQALLSIRSLLCTATNETPHERMFLHPRSSANGQSVPSWLQPGPILVKRHVRQSKYDPIVEEAELVQSNPLYSLVRLNNGRELTINNRHLAPATRREPTDSDIVEPMSETPNSSSDVSQPKPERTCTIPDPDISITYSGRDGQPSTSIQEPPTCSQPTNDSSYQPLRRSGRICSKPKYLQEYLQGRKTVSSSSLTPIRSPIREIPSTISEELGSVRSSLHEQEEHTSSKIMEEEVGGKCLCHLTKFEEIGEEEERIDPFAAREKELRKEFELHLDDEIMRMKTRFDLILQNEQVRTSCLLREAYRERQERISSLRNQLECKNLATLMFLLCSERRKKRHEIMEIIEEYTKHLKGLTDMICEGQFIMEDMIRGYKTAEKVDEEWRSKTKRLVHEFQLFTEHYFGSNPESSKFFFNLPELLKICAPIEPCPCVDVTNSEASNPSEEGETDPEAATWWYKLQSSEKPFVVFGDMADFHPQKRRQLLKYLKENKENAPEKWKEYAFNNKFLEADCPNVDAVRQKYTKHSPGNTISCEYAKFMQSDNQLNGDVVTYKTAASSMEYGCLHMGSILRLVHQASSYPAQRIVNKASILGAKDSLELMSSSKLIEKKEKRKVDLASETKSSLISDELYSLNLHYTRKKRRTSIAPGVESRTAKEYEESQQTIDDDTSDTEDITSVMSKLASVHQDSLTILSTRSPNHSQGDRIRYEKECPVKACERKYVNSLLRNLPPYMDIRNPYTEYDRTFDSYEPCTQEELEKVVSLKPTTDRMSLGRERMKRDSFSLDVLEGLVRQRETGVAVQTEQVDDCTCHLVPSCQCSALLSQLGSEAPPPSPEMCLKKQNAISSSQLYNDTIQFDRFKVIGENFQHLAEKPKEFETHRVESIMRILQNHPSLYSMFQASAPIG